VAGRASLAVVTFLVPSALRRAIVLLAPLVATLTTMMFAAAERAAQVLAARVAGMGQEANPAVATGHHTVAKIWMLIQDRIESDLILTNERMDVVVLVPIVAKRENFRDRYHKTTRFSVKTLIGLCISSSYPLDAKASRGKGEVFLCRQRKTWAGNSHASPIPIRVRNLTAHLCQPDSQTRFPPSSNVYLERKTTGSTFVTNPTITQDFLSK
jgi:hypothetical protein